MAKYKHYPPTGMGERLAVAAEKKKMDWSTLAELCGMDRKSFYLYRDNEVPMDVTTLIKVCAILKVTPNYLLYGRE